MSWRRSHCLNFDNVDTFALCWHVKHSGNFGFFNPIIITIIVVVVFVLATVLCLFFKAFLFLLLFLLEMLCLIFFPSL